MVIIVFYFKMMRKKMLLIPFMLLIYAAEWILIKTKKKIKNTCGSLRKISQSRFKLKRINKKTESNIILSLKYFYFHMFKDKTRQIEPMVNSNNNTIIKKTLLDEGE